MIRFGFWLISKYNKKNSWSKQALNSIILTYIIKLHFDAPDQFEQNFLCSPKETRLPYGELKII